MASSLRRRSAFAGLAVLLATPMAGCAWLLGVSEDPAVIETADASDAASAADTLDARDAAPVDDADAGEDAQTGDDASDDAPPD